ncbi:MAG: hypothetical protein HY063_04345 [Bacteroidetes bacterium]|nr:hypothetical protein [Bacteroidota bacterium]
MQTYIKKKEDIFRKNTDIPKRNQRWRASACPDEYQEEKNRLKSFRNARVIHPDGSCIGVDSNLCCKFILLRLYPNPYH